MARYILLACGLLMVGNAAVRAQNPDRQSFEVIEHGRYMAIAADCGACHTAKGGQLFAGGGALETPFGTLLAPNITPDVAPGIGGWTVIIDRLPLLHCRIMRGDGLRRFGAAKRQVLQVHGDRAQIGIGQMEVAAVVTYLRNAWGNAAPAVSASEVDNMRQTLRRRAHVP